MQYLNGISGMSLSKMIYPCCLIDSTKLGSILGLGNKNYSIYCKKSCHLTICTAFTLGERIYHDQIDDLMLW